MSCPASCGLLLAALVLVVLLLVIGPVDARPRHLLATGPLVVLLVAPPGPLLCPTCRRHRPFDPLLQPRQLYAALPELPCGQVRCDLRRVEQKPGKQVIAVPVQPLA